MFSKSTAAKLLCVNNDCVILGVSWQDKVQWVREKLKEKKSGALVITALDEVACK